MNYKGPLFVTLTMVILFYIIASLDNTNYTVPIHPQHDSKTIALFWTGGYDSTFRLCQLLIMDQRKVQPIYITARDVDAPTYNIVQHRKSLEKEIETMNKIREKLSRDFPHTQKLLLPTLYVDTIKPNWKESAKAIYNHYVLGKFSRPFTQYERMARFSHSYPTTIEVGLESCGTGLDHATRDIRIGKGYNCRILPTKDIPWKLKPLDIFRKFRLPMCHLTKEKCLQIAKENGFYHIMKMTWSCWRPRSDGNPCGKCEMCRKRIIF